MVSHSHERGAACLEAACRGVAAALAEPHRPHLGLQARIGRGALEGRVFVHTYAPTSARPDIQTPIRPYIHTSIHPDMQTRSSIDPCMPPCLPASLPPCLPASLPPCLPAYAQTRTSTQVRIRARARTCRMNIFPVTKRGAVDAVPRALVLQQGTVGAVRETLFKR